MIQRALCVLGTLFVASFGLSSIAAAQEVEETQAVEKTENADAAAATEDEDVPFLSWSRLSGIVQADFSNAYYFRGILQERHGLVAQPWGELYYNVFASEDSFIRDVTVGAGVWASFQTDETLAQNSPKSLYEVDW